jgi:hypothetical protein
MENISLTLKEKCLSPLNNPDKDLKILIKNIETIVEEKINNLNENTSNGGYLSQNQYDILNEDESNYSDDSITVISHESIDSDICEEYTLFKPFEKNEYAIEKNDCAIENNIENISIQEVDILGEKYYQDNKSKLIFERDEDGSIGKCLGYFTDQ